jgi:uncharacterized protein YqgC (DUF456 family)
MNIVIAIIYWLLLVISVFTLIFGLPGTFFIVIFNLLYQLVDSITGINWRLIIWLLLISICLELLEFIITAWSSKRYGASNQGTAAAIAGSVIGAIIGTGIFPVVGSLLGAIGGAFIGAFVIDLIRTADTKKAIQSGIGALTGSVGGKMIKIIGAIGMLVLLGYNMT